jgi:hypothetical protein
MYICVYVCVRVCVYTCVGTRARVLNIRMDLREMRAELQEF